MKGNTRHIGGGGRGGVATNVQKGRGTMKEFVEDSGRNDHNTSFCTMLWNIAYLSGERLRFQKTIIPLRAVSDIGVMFPPAPGKCFSLE